MSFLFSLIEFPLPILSRMAKSFKTMTSWWHTMDAQDQTEKALLESALTPKSWFDKLSANWMQMTFFNKISVAAGITLFFGLTGMTSGLSLLFSITALICAVSVHFLLASHNEHRIAHAKKYINETQELLEVKQRKPYLKSNESVLKAESSLNDIDGSHALMAARLSAANEQLAPMMSKLGSLKGAKQDLQQPSSKVLGLRQDNEFMAQGYRLAKRMKQTVLSYLPIRPLKHWSEIKNKQFSQAVVLYKQHSKIENKKVSTWISLQEKDKIAPVIAYLFAMPVAKARSLYQQLVNSSFFKASFSSNTNNLLVRVSLTKDNQIRMPARALKADLNKEKKNDAVIAFNYKEGGKVWIVELETHSLTTKMFTPNAASLEEAMDSTRANQDSFNDCLLQEEQRVLIQQDVLEHMEERMRQRALLRSRYGFHSNRASEQRVESIESMDKMSSLP